MSEDLGPDGRSKVERAINELLRDYDVGRSVHGLAYVRKKCGDNPVAYAVSSSILKNLLRASAYARDELLKREEVSEIQEQLWAYAAVSNTPWRVYLRVGPSETGGVEIDLGTPDHLRVLLQHGKASVISRGSTATFVRSDTMLPLPLPADTGIWQDLLKYLNMSKIDQYLFLCTLTFYLCHHRHSETSFPILVPKGEEGTGKSTLCRLIIRGLVDNNTSGVQMFPRDSRELAIMGTNQHVLIFDNLRRLSTNWSDILCITSTGGTISNRKLYTDSEESQLHVHSPLVLNGIHDFIREPDLASRTVTVRLERIPAKNRTAEDVLKARFIDEQSHLFRGLLNLAAATLEGAKTAKPQYSSRLTGFSRWLAAAESTMGLQDGMLQVAYRQHVQAAKFETISENALAMAMMKFAKSQVDSPWIGTPSELLRELTLLVDKRTQNRSNVWPQNPNSMSKRLKVLIGTLEEQGVFLDFRHSTHRQIEVAYLPLKDL